ncbi:multidrug and toxin extrusion protein 2-like [Pelodytes ibericus]
MISQQQPKESSPLKGRSTSLPLCLHRLLPVGLVEEIKQIIALAGPMFISQFFLYLMDVVSSIFAGHLGKIELDAVSIAVSIINVTGTSVGLGLSSACNTLMSQTYGGKNMKRVGTILQRGILILLLCCFPCWAIFINTKGIILQFGQDPMVARLAEKYVMIFIPALPAVFMFQLQIQYLQNQTIIWPQVFTGIVVNIINVLLNAIFLYGMNLGIVGSAWANTIAHILMCCMLFLYIRVKKLHVDTWTGWSSDCFQEWGNFMRLAIPSMVMVCTELWTFEIGGIVSGLISAVELGAQAIMLQLLTIAYLLPLGFSAAASVRVGNALGAGNINQAKLASRASLLCTGGFAVLMCSFLAGLNKQISYIFTSDRETISLVSLLILMYVPFHIFDALNSTCGGILQGSGNQKIGAIISGVGNYILALPVGIALMFAAKLGIVGLWIGMIVSSFLQLIVTMVFVLRLNWSKIRDEAQVLAGLKSKEMGPGADIPHQGRANAGFDLVEYGDLPSSASRQFVDDHNIPGGIIVPDIAPGGKYTGELVQQEDSAIETINVVGEILSVKQLILWRGLALVLAVTTLIIGVTIRFEDLFAPTVTVHRLFKEEPMGSTEVPAQIGLWVNETLHFFHKLEFLALKWAIVDKLHDYLYGATFEVRTDNNPLTYIQTTAKLDATGHRWLAALSSYSFSLKYKPGPKNVSADALSPRPGLPPHQANEHWEEIPGPGVGALCQTYVVAQKQDEFSDLRGIDSISHSPEAVPEILCTSVMLQQWSSITTEDKKKAQSQDWYIGTVLK